MSHLTRGLMLSAHLAALWPSLVWWGRRVSGDPSELWGAAGWPLALWLAARTRVHRAPALGLPALGLAAYAISQPLAPPLVSAAIGALSLAATVSTLYMGRRLSVPLACCMLLGLPVEASLQFYLGYPLRFVVAAVAAPMLSTLGIEVIAEGTQLTWHSLQVAVDGPCSGVRMLRTALLFSALLALIDRRSVRALGLHLAFSFGALVMANAVRATSLFLIELTDPPFEWLHAGVGVCAFAMLLYSQYAAYRWCAPGGQAAP